MIINIKLYFLSILCFVCIDAVWLGVISPSFYQQHIGELMREQFSPRPGDCILFDLLARAAVLCGAAQLDTLTEALRWSWSDVRPGDLCDI